MAPDNVTSSAPTPARANGENGRPGPEPERLKLDDDSWRDAVRRFFKRSADGDTREVSDDE